MKIPISFPPLPSFIPGIGNPLPPPHTLAHPSSHVIYTLRISVIASPHKDISCLSVPCVMSSKFSASAVQMLHYPRAVSPTLSPTWLHLMSLQGSHSHLLLCFILCLSDGDSDICPSVFVPMIIIPMVQKTLKSHSKGLGQRKK